MSALKRTVSAVASVFDMIGKKKVAVYAAASDYFLFMSLVPILMLLVSLIRYLPFEQADLLNIFADAVPPSVYKVIRTIVNSIYHSGSGVITLSVVLTLFSASSAMRAIMKGLDAVYGAERRDNIVVFFARACVYMLILSVRYGLAERRLYIFPFVALVSFYLCSITEEIFYLYGPRSGTLLFYAACAFLLIREGKRKGRVLFAAR